MLYIDKDDNGEKPAVYSILRIGNLPYTPRHATSANGICSGLYVRPGQTEKCSGTYKGGKIKMRARTFIRSVSLILFLMLCVAIHSPAQAVDDSSETDALSEGLKYYYCLDNYPYSAEQAFNYFSDAAAEGNGDAYYYLGNLALRSSDEARFDEAMRCFDQATEAGSGLGYIGKGRLYEDGQGVARDYEMARSLYSKALDMGYAEANLDLGDLYRDAHGVDRNWNAAMKYYEEAIVSGDAVRSRDAYARIGYLFRDGLDGIGTDYDKANDWFQKGMAAGSPSAIMGAALMYYFGYGVERNDQTARELLERAASQGNSGAICFIAGMLLRAAQNETDVQEARQWYQKAYEMGNPDAMIQLGNLCRDIEGDYDQGFSYFQQALDAGYAAANVCMGYSYMMLKDYETERECYLKGAELGDTTCMYNLGATYEYGDGVSANKQTALEWYQKGAEAGDVDCMLKVASFLYGEYGSSFDIDREEAWRLYSEAAVHGVPGAMGAIADYYNGHLYGAGNPDETDVDAILSWCGKALVKAPNNNHEKYLVDNVVNRLVYQGLTSRTEADQVFAYQAEHFILP